MSSVYPTPWVVGWHTYTPGVEDSHGNIGESTYEPPLDEDGEPRRVIYIAPGGSSEPNEVRVEHDIDLGVPADFTAHPNDVVDLPEGRFEVVGYPADYTRGPFGFQPGKVVELRRIQG